MGDGCLAWCGGICGRGASVPKTPDFHDAEEGDHTHDPLFEQVRQARTMFRASSLLFNGIGRSGSVSSSTNSFRHVGSQPLVGAHAEDWLTRTLREHSGDGLGSGKEPCWKKGDGQGLKVRGGPDYRRTGRKVASEGSLYEAVSCDAIKSDQKITDIMGRLIDVNAPCLSDRRHDWAKDLKVPRVLCINLMLPYNAVSVPFMSKTEQDAGCSFVGLFQVKPESVRALRSGQAGPSLRLWEQFCEGPCGAPGEQKDPDRSLGRRLRPRDNKAYQSGLFKATAFCVNPDEVNVPNWCHEYNGKPCLITNSGYIVKDPEGEWIEIGIDVRSFNIAARTSLKTLRSKLPLTQIHYGFLVQGVEDEELPEGLLCDMYVCRVHMEDTPVQVDCAL